MQSICEFRRFRDHGSEPHELMHARNGNGALLAHDFPVAVAKCVAATKRSLEATMMKSDPKLIGHAVCLHSISIVKNGRRGPFASRLCCGAFCRLLAPSRHFAATQQ